MELKEFLKYLDHDKIYDKNILIDYTDILNDRYESKDNFIMIEIPDINRSLPMMERSVYKIEFDIYASWEVINSGGDGYITQNYDYIDDLEVEIDLVNIEDYSQNKIIELTSRKHIDILTEWIKSIVEENR